MISRMTIHAGPTLDSPVTTFSGICAPSRRSRQLPPRSAPRRPRLPWHGSWPRATTSPRSPEPSGSFGVEENVAADAIELTRQQIDKLTNLTPAAGGHHTEEQMQMIER